MEEYGSLAKKPKGDNFEKNIEIVDIDSSEAETSMSENKATVAKESPVDKCPSDYVVVDAWEPEQNPDEPQCFVWDAEPSTGTSSDVPLYRSNFSAVLKEFDAEDSNPNKKIGPSRFSCFNCLGDHIMNDCTQPRDFQAISKNRREFMNKSKGFNKQNTRYHLGDSQVYANMQPGKISNELRKALGISEDRLPRHIYKMRQLGYPPAWLEEAKVSGSGLAMFDSKDDVTLKEQETETLPEVYDVSKIIEFPGFNVEPAAGTIDDGRFLNFPPMSSRQSKKEMVKHLEHLNATAERRKRRSSPKPNLDDLIVIDQVEEDSDKEERMADSPSLADLETQKQLLMAELEGANNSLTGEAEPTELSTPNTSLKVGEVKHIALGTPILKSASPYSRIPAADNFSQGMCDVINFENLPGSTGHYVRMSDVIQKIRKSTSGKEENLATSK